MGTCSYLCKMLSCLKGQAASEHFWSFCCGPGHVSVFSKRPIASSGLRGCSYQWIPQGHVGFRSHSLLNFLKQVLLYTCRNT